MAQYKTIYTTKGENPAAIINECSKIEEDVIKLYLPEYSAFFEDRSNFELLRREADFLGKEIIILTLDKEGVGLAQAAGFSVQTPSEQQRATSEDSSVPVQALVVEKEPTPPKRFVDISGSPRRPLSELEPIEKHEVVSIADLEKDPSAVDFEAALRDDSITSKDEPEVKERDQALSDFIKHREERPIETRSLKERRSSKLQLPGSFKWVAVGVGGLLMFYIAIFVLPRANITVHAGRQPVNFEASVVVDKNLVKVNKEVAKIPGQVMELTESLTKTYSATGSANNSNKAQGTITIFNEQTAPQAMIPSRFQAVSGKIYWTQANIVVPGATKQGDTQVPGKIEALVVANDAGSGSELVCSIDAPCRLTVPAWKGTEKFQKIYGQSSASITAGLGEGAKVVTADDLKAAEADLRADLKVAALANLSDKLAAGLRLINESASFDYQELAADKAVGAGADSFSLNGKVKAMVIAVSNDDVVTFVDETVQSRVADDKRTYLDTVEVSFKDVVADIEKGEVRMVIAAKEEVGWRLSEAELTESFRGKSLEALYGIDFVKEKIADIDVKFWPIWVNSIPTRASRINFTIN